jgi:hypothetical protein
LWWVRGRRRNRLGEGRQRLQRVSSDDDVPSENWTLSANRMRGPAVLMAIGVESSTDVTQPAQHCDHAGWHFLRWVRGWRRDREGEGRQRLQRVSSDDDVPSEN